MFPDGPYLNLRSLVDHSSPNDAPRDLVRRDHYKLRVEWQNPRVMYGDLGLRLIRDSKRTISLPALPPPQLSLIRQVLQEINVLDQSASDILQALPSLTSIQQDYPSEACAILIHHLCMRRNRRCLLAYQRLRADRLDEMMWANGDIKGMLSPEEEEYARGYALLVAGLKGRWTDIELGGSLEPPKDLYVEVRVLKDAGEIQTEYGYDHPELSANNQGHHPDEEQSAICSTGGCGKTNSTRLFTTDRVEETRLWGLGYLA